ncbi:MAG TPA: SxtJ family membrane protein [Candidatus Binatia bacterium]|nr:SxtJ family membrane protein [Candidatus Binatia bacterium]
MPAPSASELRRFGLTVGGMFLLLGTLSWWRGHVRPPVVFWTLGVLLVVPGLVAPMILEPVRRGWMRFGMLLGEVNSRIILGVMFYVVIAPVGFVLRTFFRDPLDRKLDDGKTSTWIRRERAPVDPARYEQQF